MFLSCLASKIIDVRNYTNYFTHSNPSIMALVCSDPEIIVVILNGEIFSWEQNLECNELEI